MINSKLPPMVYRQKTRHGRIVYYFRSGVRRHGPRIRLPDFGTPEFEPAYSLALTGGKSSAPIARPASDTRSLAWLIAQYRATSAYQSELSRATRKQRDNIFKHVVDANGAGPFAEITRQHIVAGREARSATPYQAKHFIDTMRGVFRWALEAGLVAEDPTAGVKYLKAAKGEGFAAWNDADVERYEEHWPAGSRERVWMHVLLYTGLRRGDAVQLGRQHVRNGVAMLRTEKTTTDIYVRILPQLAETLAIGPIGELTFIAGQNGKPLVKESFGNLFREACNAAGVKKSAHGLRKLAATRAAEAGATVNELEALFGWKGGKMASHYTESASRARLAAAASDKIEGIRK